MPGLPGQPDRIYFETGNGPGKLGDSFVKLETTDWPPGLIYDWSFQPKNAAALNAGDTDLGSGGPVWLPGGILVGGGKQGRYYVLDRRSMLLTQDAPSADGFEGFQAFTNTYNTYPFTGIPRLCQPAYHHNPDFKVPCGGWSDPNQSGCYIDPRNYQDGEQCGPNIHAGPVYWSAANDSYGLLYQMAEKDYVKAFRYDKSTHQVTPYLTSSCPSSPTSCRPVPGMPGGFSSLSADINRDAILWTSVPLGNGQADVVPGRLVAFDATSLNILWQHDGYTFAKFVPPTIADGKVFRATFSNKVVVYGLRTIPWWKLFSARSSSITPWWKKLFALFSPPKPPPPPPEAFERAAIEEKFRLAGGSAGLLKSPAGEAKALQDAAGGWYQDYRGLVVGPSFSTASVRPAPNTPIPTCSHPQAGGGTPLKSSIYWSRKTGARLVMGDIREFWLKQGGPKGALGYPISDEEPTPDGLGRMSAFEHGKIWWYLDKGAFVPGAKHEEQPPKT